MLSTSSFILLLCLFGSCTPQDTQDLILSTLRTLISTFEALTQKQDTVISTLDALVLNQHKLLQKNDGLENKMTFIEGLENKMTFIEESQKTLEEKINQSKNTLEEKIDQSQKTLEEKIDQSKNTLEEKIDQSIKTLEERIIGQQGDMRTSIQQCSTRDQLTTFQHLIAQDECEEGSANCSASATCTDAIGQYKCVCIQGYSGDGITCEDIDECNTNDAICGEGNTCINHPGTYGCLCHDGFIEVNHFCTDVDECSESNNVCGTEQICSNFPGNYSCACHEGYEKEGNNCQDINECTSDVHLCSANATCNNTEGSYTCQCFPYYYGDGFTCNDCQIELNKARKVLLDTLNIGMDNLTSAREVLLRESLEQKEPQCVRKPISNCKELLDNRETASGVYTITPEGFLDGVELYCDQATDGGGWSVIFQRNRQTQQQLSFVRTFEEYAAGFGDPNGEIWIGNRVLHAMTGAEPFTLRVDAKNLQGESRTGIWHTFSVGSQDTQFTLSVAGYSSNSTLGDGLTRKQISNGMKFSTYDRDNDKSSDDCSGKYGKGGWWYNSCFRTNPTAPLGDTNDNGQMANWLYWERSSSSSEYNAISEIQFKIRP